MADQWYAWETRGTKVDKPKIPFAGTWHNDLDSQMELKVGADGALSGKYRTRVGAPQDSEEFALVGSVNGDLIAFVVNWGAYGSVTAWVGQHTADEGGAHERIVTLWHLGKNLSEGAEAGALWGAITAGANTFTRV